MTVQHGHSVRIAGADDAGAIRDIYAPYVLDTAISFEEVPPTLAEMAERVASTLPTHPYLVCEERGRIVGYAYAATHADRPAYRWSVNVSVYVEIGAHRRGIGRALYLPLIDILTQQGFHSVFAGIALPNHKSIGLHEALGFSSVGVYREVGFKHGRWHDVGWWRLGLREGLPAAEPIPFAAIDDRDDLVAQGT